MFAGSTSGRAICLGRVRLSAFAIPLLAATASLSLAATSASAAHIHRFLSTASGSSEAPAPLAGPIGLAVDNSGGANVGDSYVADSGNNVIDRFDSSGPYLCQITGAGSSSTSPSECDPGGTATVHGSLVTPFGLAVDPADGSLYAADLGHGVVDKFDHSGNVVSGFGTGGQISGADIAAGQVGSPGNGNSFDPTGVAVDPGTGDLYVADNPNAVIDVFSSAGAYKRQFPSIGSAWTLAMDTQGNLLVANTAEVVAYVAATGLPNPSFGSGTGQLDARGSTGVTVDRTNGDLYVADREYIAAYDAAGNQMETFGAGNLGFAIGVAIDETSGYLYAADNAFGDFAIFSQITVPDAMVTPVTSQTPTSVTLNGHVDTAGAGPITECKFEFGTTDAYGESVPCAPPVPLATATDVSADLSGLAAPNTYHYRLVVANSTGANVGKDQTVTVLPFEPTIDSTGYSNVSQSSATLEAQIKPGFGLTVYRFQYGTSSSYGEQTYPGDSIGSDNTDHLASTEITGLAPGVTYHFRALATNFIGTVTGPDQTFTSHSPASISSTSVSAISRTSATLGAVIAPGFSPTTYHFEYGTTTAYGMSTPQSGSIGADDSAHPASAAVAGLAPGTTYHYRVVATNAVGVSEGPDQEFTTEAPSVVPSTPPRAGCKAGFSKRGKKCVRKQKKHHKSKHRSRSGRHA